MVLSPISPIYFIPLPIGNRHNKPAAANVLSPTAKSRPTSSTPKATIAIAGAARIASTAIDAIATTFRVISIALL